MTLIRRSLQSLLVLTCLYGSVAHAHEITELPMKVEMNSTTIKAELFYDLDAYLCGVQIGHMLPEHWDRLSGMSKQQIDEKLKEFKKELLKKITLETEGNEGEISISFPDYAFDNNVARRRLRYNPNKPGNKILIKKESKGASSLEISCYEFPGLSISVKFQGGSYTRKETIPASGGFVYISVPEMKDDTQSPNDEGEQSSS